MAPQDQPTPVHLARRSYRQRRLRDAARMLPIVGLVLWLLPLTVGAPLTSRTGLYIFAVWIVLIIVAAGIAARLRDDLITPPGAQDSSTDVR